MSEGDPDKIGIQDAFRLKHEVNKSIKYGGNNALELKDLEDLSDEQRAKLDRYVSLIKKHWWVFPDWVNVIGFIVAGFSLFYFKVPYARLFCLLALIYCASQIAYRKGVYYGYVRGFKEGHGEGVHRALGISPEDASDASERATQMTIDEGIIGQMDERKD